LPRRMLFTNQPSKKRAAINQCQSPTSHLSGESSQERVASSQ
jgi:hypothetical protein